MAPLYIIWLTSCISEHTKPLVTTSNDVLYKVSDVVGSLRPLHEPFAGGTPTGQLISVNSAINLYLAFFPGAFSAPSNMHVVLGNAQRSLLAIMGKE